MNAKEPLFCRQRPIEEVLLEEVLQKIAADMILPAGDSGHFGFTLDANRLPQKYEKSYS